MRLRRLLRQFVTLATVCCTLFLFAHLFDSVLDVVHRTAIISRLIPRNRLSTFTTTTAKNATSAGDQILGDDAVRFFEKIPSDIDTLHKGAPKIIVSWDAGHSQENLGGCPDWNCVLTDDHSRVAEADAVLLQNPDISVPSRRPEQYYVHFNQESPVHHGVADPYPGYFNLSLGYRRDGALPSPYGYAIKLNTPLSIAYAKLSDDQLKAKTKPIAWFVSNCGTTSRREHYVDELTKHIVVDKFGFCGDKECPKGPACEQTIRTDYRFYLALENSICKDYITEKFWNQGFLDVVPIVFKRVIVEKYAPPGSFIALDDFKSPKHLADHLNALMINDTAYQSYFSWRTDYKIVFLNGVDHDYKERPWGICRLCKLLWQQPRPVHVFDNFNTWWTEDAHCDRGELVNKLLAYKD